MSDIRLIPAPAGHRWRFSNYTPTQKELRLEKRGLIFWHPVARCLLSDYGDPQDVVTSAARRCLEGFDWLEEVRAYIYRNDKIQAERSRQFPTGVVE